MKGGAGWIFFFPICFGINTQDEDSACTLPEQVSLRAIIYCPKTNLKLSSCSGPVPAAASGQAAASSPHLQRKQEPPAGVGGQGDLNPHIEVLLHLLPEAPFVCPGAQTHLGQDGDLFAQMPAHRKWIFCCSGAVSSVETTPKYFTRDAHRCPEHKNKLGSPAWHWVCCSWSVEGQLCFPAAVFASEVKLLKVLFPSSQRLDQNLFHIYFFIFMCFESWNGSFRKTF